MRLSLAGLALCTALLVSSAPARADAPIIIGPISDSGTAFIWSCGAFDILDEYEANFTVRRMRDRDGTVIRLVEQVWGVDTFVNSVTGKALPAPYHNNTFVDFAAGRANIAGIIFKVVVPGVGPVFMDLGMITADREDNVYFSAGPHQFFDGDFEALCAALE
jgi:hypothetical protein